MHFLSFFPLPLLRFGKKGSSKPMLAPHPPSDRPSHVEKAAGRGGRLGLYWQCGETGGGVDNSFILALFYIYVSPQFRGLVPPPFEMCLKGPSGKGTMFLTAGWHHDPSSFPPLKVMHGGQQARQQRTHSHMSGCAISFKDSNPSPKCTSCWLEGICTTGVPPWNAS